MAKGHKKFRMEYGQQLVDHMAKGFSIRSFAAQSEIPYSTLQYWAENNKNFAKFKELGESKSQHYWETVGIAAAQGQLQRVKSTVVKKTTLYDANGKEMADGEGKPAIKEEIITRSYEPTKLEGSIWKFIMSSRFGWYDKQDPATLDPEKAGPATTLRKFQLAYNLDDQPYVVKPGSRSTEEAEAPDSSTDPAINTPSTPDVDNPAENIDNSSTHPGETPESTPPPPMSKESPQ